MFISRVYYAHHLWKYNTKIEDYELRLIGDCFPTAIIMNPNGDIPQEGSEESIMEECFDLIGSCEVLVFSSVNGVVGKGVYDEVNLALKHDKPIFYIFNNSVVRIIGLEWQVIQESERVYAIPKFIGGHYGW